MNIPPAVKVVIRRHLGRFLISRDGFWFVDIPRTSSSSLRAELGKAYGLAHAKKNREEAGYAARDLFFGHQTGAAMRDLLGTEIWEQLFTFSMVRNPWDRIVSYYFFSQRHGHITRDLSFKDYLTTLEVSASRYRPILNSASFPNCVDHLADENGDLIVDFVARYENRVEDVQVIASRLNMPALGQVWIQKASPASRHYSEYYDEESRSMVASLCAKDINYFGYAYDDRS